jgi:hypothetical protein
MRWQGSVWRRQKCYTLPIWLTGIGGTDSRARMGRVVSAELEAMQKVSLGELPISTGAGNDVAVVGTTDREWGQDISGAALRQGS